MCVCTCCTRISYVCNTEVIYTYVICSLGAKGVRPFFSSRRIGSFFFLRLPCHVSKAPMLALSVCSGQSLYVDSVAALIVASFFFRQIPAPLFFRIPRCVSGPGRFLFFNVPPDVCMYVLHSHILCVQHRGNEHTCDLYLWGPGGPPFFFLSHIGSFFFVRVLAGMSKAHSLGTNTSLVLAWRRCLCPLSGAISIHLYIYISIHLYIYTSI